MITFYSHAHLGDNLRQLHFLRKLVERDPGLRFTQYLPPEGLEQLIEVVEDRPEIIVKSVVDRPSDAVNSWIGSDGFLNTFPGRNLDYVKFTLAWLDHLAIKVGLTTPHQTVEDLLFDWPALLMPISQERFDILVINSEPCSGQLLSYDRKSLDTLAIDLSRQHRVITTEKVEGLVSTRDYGLSLSGIGSLSREVKAVVGVATGPLWPTLNVWNHRRIHLRVLMVDNEQLNFDESCQHSITTGQTRHILVQEGFLNP